MYLQDRIDTLRKDIDKHGKVKTKKGQQQPPPAKVLPLHSILCSLALLTFVITFCFLPCIFWFPCLSGCLNLCSQRSR